MDNDSDISNKTLVNIISYSHVIECYFAIFLYYMAVIVSK